MSEEPPRSGSIDPAAMVWAGVAVIVGWMLGEGAWGPASIPIGLLVIGLVLGFSTPPGGPALSYRAVLRRLTGSAVLAFGAAFVLAWPTQELIVAHLVTPACAQAPDCVAGTTTTWLVVPWLLVTVGYAAAERRLAGMLDRPRPTR